MSAPVQRKEEVGVPFQLLQDFKNKVVNVDTATGDVYNGTLLDVEDTMSVTLKDVKAVFASGYESEMNSIYVRGNKIRYITLPEGAEKQLQHFLREAEKSKRGRGGRGGSRGGGGRGRFGGGDRRRY